MTSLPADRRFAFGGGVRHWEGKLYAAAGLVALAPGFTAARLFRPGEIGRPYPGDRLHADGGTVAARGRSGVRLNPRALGSLLLPVATHNLANTLSYVVPVFVPA